MRSRFLVTGGRGFIGSALVRMLIRDGNHVMNLDLGTYAAVPGALSSVERHPDYILVSGSISDSDLVRESLREFQPTAVINLAAESHVDRSIDHSAPFIDTNVIGAFTLLQEATNYWRSLEVQAREDFRFIQVSTDEVYGSIASGEATVETRYNPSSPYAATKAASDHLANAWYVTYGLPVMVTNCSNNYGPYQFPEKLIPLCLVRAMTGRTIPLYGDGEQVRDWIYVDDHCRGILTVVNRGIPGQTYLIGARVRLSNKALVAHVCERLDELDPREDGRPHEVAVEFVDDRPGHDLRYAVDPSSAESLGFRPEVAFADGLTSTVSWYVKNRSWWETILEATYDTTRLGVGR